MITSFDGTPLFFKGETPLEPKAAVLIVHGLCEHQGRYNYLSEQLLAKGYAVYRFDHRGHGQSEGPRTYYDDYTQIFKDVNVVVDLVKTEQPHLPLYIIGHSMGGYAVALFGSHFPGKAAGFIFSGALTRKSKDGNQPMPADLDPKSYISNNLGSGICSDPRVVEDYASDPLVVKEISIGLFNSIYHGVRWLRENPDCFVDPIYILHGAKDGLVSCQDSLDFFTEIGSEDKTLKVYARLQHEIFNEYSKDEVIGDVLYWLEKHIDPNHISRMYTQPADSMIEDLGL